MCSNYFMSNLLDGVLDLNYLVATDKTSPYCLFKRDTHFLSLVKRTHRKALVYHKTFSPEAAGNSSKG